MTSTDQTPAAAGTPARPSTALRRALGLEVHQHRDVLAFHGVVAVILILLAWLPNVPFGIVAILLAARLPADLADQVPEDGRMLRSSLGISRADAIRARFLVVTGGQLMLAIAAAWVILVTDHGSGQSHWSTFEFSRDGFGPSPLTLRDHLVDIGLWSGAIAWTHALIGGEAFRLDKRPTGRRAIALFLGVSLLSYLMFRGSMMLTSYVLTTAGIGGVDGSQFVAAATTAQIVALVLTLGGGITALLMARRRWIRRA